MTFSETKTLGDIIDARAPATAAMTETEWAGLVERIAAGDRQALHAVYQKTHNAGPFGVREAPGGTGGLEGNSMNSMANNRHQNYQELAALYTLRSLPPDEAAAFEAHLETCGECRREIETLRPVTGSFSAWPADVLRPDVSLWGRLSERIAGKSGAATVAAPGPSSPDPDWEDVAPGISCHLLAVDRARSRVTMLVRLAPGTDYPPHRHADIEELHLLDGELVVDDRTLQPGDYIRSAAGSVDRRVWSGSGCTCVLSTSTKDTIL